MSISLRRMRSHSLLIALAAVAFVLLAPIQAQAKFQLSVSASTSVTTPTLAPITNPTVSQSKCNLLLGQAYLVVGWTPSTYAAGYRVTPLLNGTTAQTTITVTGGSTNTVDVPVVRGVLVTNPYTFRIQAFVGSWTSTTVTTPTPGVNCPL